jgi:UPF0042 nucleotide-binding protein
VLLVAAVGAAAVWVMVRAAVAWLTGHPAAVAAVVALVALGGTGITRLTTRPHSQEEPVIQVVIQTIGLLHPGARDLIGDGLYFDLSDRLRNPAANRALRYATGLDPAVREHVLSTPGAMQVVERIAEQTQGALAYADRRHRLVRVTVACRGGRHRSVAIAEETARYLRTSGVGVEVEHRHIHLPVIER